MKVDFEVINYQELNAMCMKILRILTQSSSHLLNKLDLVQ